MTIPSRLLRTLAATALVAWAVLPGAGAVLADRQGDLYVATPKGIAEVLLATEDIQSTTPTPDPTALAFTNGGKLLFILDSAGALQGLDIETFESRSYGLSAKATAIAHPKGDALFIAYQGSDKLGILADSETTPGNGPKVSGKPDLLAASRLDYRAVAARFGESWVDVVEMLSGDVQSLTVDGEVRALAVDGGGKVAYAATTGPDQLVRIDLDTAKVDWTTDLSGTPVAVTPIKDAGIVSVGAKLYKVGKGGAEAWSVTPDGPVTALATSDDGGFVYATTADQVVAINRDDPTADPPATVAIDGGVALAPVSEDSTLVPNGGQTTNPENGTGAGGKTSTGDDRGAKPTRAPATDTEDAGAPRWHRPGPDPLTLFGGMAGIVVLVLVVSHHLMKHTLTE